MRPLLLVMNTVVVAILLLSYTNLALADSETNKQKVLSNDSNDAWNRVRLGMKMPWSKQQIKISEKKSLTNSVAQHNIDSQESKPETVDTQTAIPPEKLTKSKYINPPYTAKAPPAAQPPIYNYTELGLRLRFGSDKPPSDKSTESQQLAAVDKKIELPDVVEKKNPKKAMIDERINKYVVFFSQKPSYLYRVTERARPYLHNIVEELNKKQLPLELALLPIVESAYQSTAQSPKGAAGLWQFMPATGKDYGLNQGEQYDDRLDTLASTRAAIRFLSDLKNHFHGDWLLALAAYNCGQGAVDNAISRNIAEGLDTDYWSLRLPKETQDYVPRLLALSNIFANPKNYGLAF